MTYDISVAKIFFDIAEAHPELLRRLPSTDRAFSDFESELGLRGTFYYSKNFECELASLCDKYGSDKGEIISSGHPYPWPSHTYSDYYKRLWGHCREKVRKVFECGLGTNNPNLPSSMGKLGKPGASLRVWRDYFPNAQIYGADIDRDILFAEDRIRSFYIDQLSPEAVNQCWSEIGEENFDFIIDDGLHTFEAGSCLFTHSIRRLSREGIYIIEDVNEIDLRKYKEFFKSKNYLVDYICLYRNNLRLGDNSLVAIRWA
jgi:hypothetical protein